MRGPLLLMDHFNDWDLQAVVRSCATVSHPVEQRQPACVSPPRDTVPAPEAPAPEASNAQAPDRAAPAAVVKDASLRYGLEYLDLDHKPFLLPPATSAGDDTGSEVMISFPAPAAAASTSGTAQLRAALPGRKPGARTSRPKRSKKSQLKKVVREMPVPDGGASSSSDPWAWRKYGQKPIKGSPYPRGYYKCSSMKGCMARKLVERSPAKPGVLIVTYLAEHCHPVPTQLNALAGTTRHKPSAAAEDRAAASSSSQDLVAAAEDAARCDVVEGSEAALAAECGAEEPAAVVADDENEFWPAEMDLDDLLAPIDDDFDFHHVVGDGGKLERRLSL